MNTSWRRPLGALLLIVLLAGSGCEAQRSVVPPAAKAAPSPLQVRLEALAGSLKYFPTGDVIYDRLDATPSLSFVEPELLELLNDEHDPEAILPLLRHEDSKVRTLALALLFDCEEPRWLPQIVSLADDEAETFLDSTIVASITHVDLSQDKNIDSLIAGKQTVGQIAELMARKYLSSAGYHYGTAGSSGREPGFAEYWNLRHSESTALDGGK